MLHAVSTRFRRLESKTIAVPTAHLCSMLPKSRAVLPRTRAGFGTHERRLSVQNSPSFVAAQSKRGGPVHARKPSNGPIGVWYRANPAHRPRVGPNEFE
jgi:hypothetical protein